jgi:hypothetical protein
VSRCVRLEYLQLGDDHLAGLWPSSAVVSLDSPLCDVSIWLSPVVNEADTVLRPVGRAQ